MMAATSNVSSSRWKWATFGLALLLFGLIVWNGADRRASDASQPMSQGSSLQSPGPSPKTLRLGSFNIHGGKGTDGVLNLARTTALLDDLDFVGLYEVRSIPFANPSNQAASIASVSNSAWLFAPTERQWWTDHFGNGLVYRIPVSFSIRLPLINTRGKAYRNAILATVLLENVDVRVISVHIDRERDRLYQLQSMIDLFLNLKEPCVLMGDLNTMADDPLIAELLERPGVESPLHDSLATGPPRATIDWIFTRGLKTISATLVENVASDHPLLKAELEPYPVRLPADETMKAE